MSRAIPPEFIAGLAQGADLFLLFEANFDSGTVLLWTGVGEFISGGKTYVGAGNLISIAAVEETSAVIARGMTVGLSGISSELTRHALTEPYQGRTCVVRLGIVEIEATVELFRGFVDQMNLEDSAASSAISVAIEHELVELLRQRVRKYTHENQQQRYPGDMAFEFVTDLKRDLEWGGS